MDPIEHLRSLRDDSHWNDESLRIPSSPRHTVRSRRTWLAWSASGLAAALAIGAVFSIGLSGVFGFGLPPQVGAPVPADGIVSSDATPSHSGSGLDAPVPGPVSTPSGPAALPTPAPTLVGTADGGIRSCGVSDLSLTVPRGFGEVRGTTLAITAQLTNVSRTACVALESPEVGAAILGLPQGPIAASWADTGKLGGTTFIPLEPGESLWFLVTHSTTSDRVGESCPLPPSLKLTVAIYAGKGPVADIPGSGACVTSGPFGVSGAFWGMPPELQTSPVVTPTVSACPVSDLSVRPLPSPGFTGGGDFFFDYYLDFEVTNIATDPTAACPLLGPHVAILPFTGGAASKYFGSWTSASLPNLVGFLPRYLKAGQSAQLRVAIAPQQFGSTTCKTGELARSLVLTVDGSDGGAHEQIVSLPLPASVPPFCTGTRQGTVQVGDWSIVSSR